MDEDQQVNIVFDSIGNAAQLCRVVQPGACADALQSQVDRSFSLDPTMAQVLLGNKAKDLDRKMRLLRAAQAFVDVFVAIGDEIVKEIDEKEKPQ